MASPSALSMLAACFTATVGNKWRQGERFELRWNRPSLFSRPKLAMQRSICFLLFLSAATFAFAQDRPPLYGRGEWNRWNQPMVQLEPVKLEGAIKQTGNGEMLITTDSNETWRVGIAAPPKDISFTGQAEESFLKKGMYVQFVARLNKRGYAQEPIKAVVITSPDAAGPPGVSTGSTAPVNDGPGGGLFSNAEPEPKAKKGPKKPAPRPEDTDVQVTGPLTQIRAGKFIVSADGESIRAELDEAVKVTVSTSDLSYVRPGDKVEISGQMIKDRKGLARATAVSIVAKEPLADESKRKPPTKPADDKQDGEKKEASPAPGK